jgi:hypothetical protein
VREERAGDGRQLEAEFAEADEEAGGEIRRDAEAVHAALHRRENDGIGHAGGRVGLAQVVDDLGEVEHLVEGRLLLGAADLEQREQADLPAADAEGREGIRGVETREPPQVGVLGRGRHQQDVGRGRGLAGGGLEAGHAEHDDEGRRAVKRKRHGHRAFLGQPT